MEGLQSHSDVHNGVAWVQEEAPPRDPRPLVGDDAWCHDWLEPAVLADEKWGHQIGWVEGGRGVVCAHTHSQACLPVTESCLG